MFDVKENNKFIWDNFMFIPFIVKQAMIFSFVLMTIILEKQLYQHGQTFVYD